MSTVKLNGIDVQFPFEPYPLQKTYMSQVIRSARDVSLIKLCVSSSICRTLFIHSLYFSCPRKRTHSWKVQPVQVRNRVSLFDYILIYNRNEPELKRRGLLLINLISSHIQVKHCRCYVHL